MYPYPPREQAVEEQRGCSNFARKCISTTPIRVPIYIWPWAAIPLALPCIDTGSRGVRERERNVLFNDTINTFYLRLYGIRHMVKDHSDSEKGNPLPPHRVLLLINSKGSFICTIPHTG